MFEELNERRKAVERNIAKGFGIDDVDLDLEKALEDEFEKGRAKKQFNIGDTFTRHGITYKCTGISANTGRPTWSKVKDGEGSKQEQPEKKEDEESKQEQKKRYLLKPDGTPVDMSKETDDNLSFTKMIIKNNIKDYKDKLDKLSPGAKKSRQIIEADIEKQEGMLAEIEEEIERRKKQATQQSKKDDAGKQEKSKKEVKIEEKKDEKLEKFISECEKEDLAYLNAEVKRKEFLYNYGSNGLKYQKEAEKVLSKRKKERKEWLEERNEDFTEEEVYTYLSKYNLQDKPSAIVENRWHTLMGRIGNTSSSIRIGKGKEKSFDSYNTPDWRPIGRYSYSVRGYKDWIDIKGTIQSWEDVRKCLSDTEDMSISIYKHPKQ